VSGLTDFQAEVSRLFFSLPASHGFLLAGGGALLASGLTTRPTQDLSFFGDPRTVNLRSTSDQFEAAAVEHGWQCTRVQVSDTFVRLRVSGDDEVIVDLGLDAPPERPSVVTIVGPTFDPEKLAGRKLVALCDRAEARDFADVSALTQRFDRSVLLQRAAEIDLGFDLLVLAEMMRTIDRFTNDELPVNNAEVDGIRGFFHRWANELDHTAEIEH
jgi:hypothetical protein